MNDYLGAFVPRLAPDAAASALLLIDLQRATGARDGALGRKMKAEGSRLTDYRFDRIERLVLPYAAGLAQAFRAAGRPVVHVTIGAAAPDAADAPAHMRLVFREFRNHVGSREHDVLDAVKPVPGDHMVRKTTIGAFASTGIDSLLRALGCGQLYLCGVSTNMCVESTAREAADRGYRVTLVEDACAATHADLHDAALRNFGRLFGCVRTTGQVLGELGFAAR
ncbi:MAG: cysteine hydrolase family protein [Lautropia sp.]